MSSGYGVVPTGFNRKPLSVLLAEIEESNRATFGPEVIQTAQSPLGQINGLFANLLAREWEYLEDIYQSYDPDQSEGTRLEMLGRLRLLVRGTGETDTTFRQAITNAGRARIDLQDITAAIRGITGVSYAQVFINETDQSDERGMAGHSVAVAVLGGDDATIASTVREYVVPGIGTYGNFRIDSTIDGFCRSIWIIRPEAVPIWLSLTIRVSPDINGCPPPSPAAIAVGITQALSSGVHRVLNGQHIDLHLLRTVAASLYGSTVEIVSAAAGRASDTQEPVPHTIGFFEIAEISAANVNVVVTP